MYTAYINGECRLPKIDWETNQLPPPTSLRTMKKYRRRVEALNRLYKTDRAHVGHVAWITQDCSPRLLPLLKVIDRIIGAERDLTKRGWLSASELADLQSIS